MLADILFPINAEAFTYSVPKDLECSMKIGCRVHVPFRRGEKVGIVVGTCGEEEYKPYLTGRDMLHPRGNRCIALKSIHYMLDEYPFIPVQLINLLKWVSQYYMSTTGLALKNAVPSGFFSGGRAGKARILYDTDVRKRDLPELTQEQRDVLKKINMQDQGVFLLHGVTGSGKTEVYINAIKSMPEKRTAIVLVPEIAMTAQMIDRFRARFGEEVVFYHSGLSAGERMINWQKMRNHEARVVVGVRSAVFAPFEHLGLIVIDEEQEISYKQFEGLRYHARDVALARSQLETFKVVLGSATPSIEIYHNAIKGKFRYLRLAHRIDRKPMPRVELIDMTREAGRTLTFSDRLLEAIKANTASGNQSLLMLNRRGYAPFFLCADCGYTYKCLSCSITLIYHRDSDKLKCHYCNSFLKPHRSCPACKGRNFKYIGAGTQRIEEELNKILPQLSMQRMDRDSTQKKLSHYRIVRKMEDHQIDLLLGTQMVAKGHDFPAVTLSAAVSSDVALNLPDFRTAERSFQLFTQLAGRAGRGDAPGVAYIQTFEPFHYVFDYVIHHDYRGFYKREINLRRQLSYPPFTKLIRIILSFKNKDTAEKTVTAVRRNIKSIDRKGVDILGPAPAPIEKIKSLWRWHMILKGNNSQALRRAAAGVTDMLHDSKDMRIDIDVDPVSMM